MNLETKEDKIKSVHRRWVEQYGKYPSDLSEMDITSIVGNTSWTKNTCDECRTDCEILVTIGEEPDYDSLTASICKNCLNKALKMIKSYEKR